MNTPSSYSPEEEPVHFNDFLFWASAFTSCVQLSSTFPLDGYATDVHRCVGGGAQVESADQLSDADVTIKLCCFLLKMEDLTQDQTHTCGRIYRPSPHYPQGTRDLPPLYKGGLWDRSSWLSAAFFPSRTFSLLCLWHLPCCRSNSVISSSLICC